MWIGLFVVGRVCVQIRGFFILKPGLRALLFLKGQSGVLLRRVIVQWNVKPVLLDAEWLWELVSCSSAIDSMTGEFTTKACARAGSLCADREMCLPLVLAHIPWLRWTDRSTSPKSHLLNTEITSSRPWLSLMPLQPYAGSCSFCYRGRYCSKSSLMCSILFTVTLGWKVKVQSKHGPLAGPEMTAQRGSAPFLLLDYGSSRKPNHHMPFICRTEREKKWGEYFSFWRTANKWWCIHLHIVCKRIILHIWLMPCLVTWPRQLIWFMARFTCIV